MMTDAEKLSMYREKNCFVACIADVFAQNPKGHTVADIKYEVWRHVTETGVITIEWIIVHFEGGGKSPCRVTGNSNLANYSTIGRMIDGGYYEEVDWYERMPELGYEKVDLRRHSF